MTSRETSMDKHRHGPGKNQNVQGTYHPPHAWSRGTHPARWRARAREREPQGHKQRPRHKQRSANRHERKSNILYALEYGKVEWPAGMRVFDFLEGALVHPPSIANERVVYRYLHPFSVDTSAACILAYRAGIRPAVDPEFIQREYEIAVHRPGSSFMKFQVPVLSPGKFVVDPSTQDKCATEVQHQRCWFPPRPDACENTCRSKRPYCPDCSVIPHQA